MDRAKVVLYAATSRIVLGLVALLLLPELYPGLAAHRWLLGAYVVSALFFQALIWKQIGGTLRSTIAGIIDLALLTFILHRVGTIATMLVSVYFFAAIANTLVVGRRVGLFLASVASVMYCGVVAAEATGLLPYGPDAPAWHPTAPGAREAVIAAVLVTTLLIASSFIVGMLVHTIRLRERELEAANEQLSELSQRDPLTQLYNRRHVLMRLEQELERVKRGKRLAVAMVDLDRFKRVNDTAGHLRGDELLRDLAAALAATTRNADVAARYGGDEFVVLLSDAGPEQAKHAAQRIVAAVREVGSRWDESAPVTASVGVASAVGADTAQGVLRRADDLAYRAKTAGGDRVVFEDA